MQGTLEVPYAEMAKILYYHRIINQKALSNSKELLKLVAQLLWVVLMVV